MSRDVPRINRIVAIPETTRSVYPSPHSFRLSFFFRRRRRSTMSVCAFIEIPGDDGETVDDDRIQITNIDGSRVEEIEVKRTSTKIAAWALPGHAENVLVDAISYVPTDEQINMILEKGNAVIAANDADGMMDVKGGARKLKDPLGSVWFNEQLVFGTEKNQVPARVAKQKELYDNGDVGKSDFAMAFNREAPMTFDPPSMGMNGILTNFEEKNRVNLFVGTKDDVFNLLGGFLKFRCEHQDRIIEQTITDMNTEDEDPKPNKKARALPSALLDLALVVKRKNNTTFASLGIGLHSFCQTWDVDTKKPNFSEQSPHFQTKVVVRNPARLFNELSAYEGTKNANELCDKFVDYGNRVLGLKKAFGSGYAKKFVDVDALYRNMAATRSMDELVGRVLTMLGGRET